MPGLPGFGETAERRGGRRQPAADLITAIALGAADQLTGRILHPRDDLSALTAQCQSQPDRRLASTSADSDSAAELDSAGRVGGLARCACACAGPGA